MSEANDFYKELGNEEKAKAFSQIIGVEPKQGKEIFLDLFLYSHGIAVLTATGKLSFDSRNLEKMLQNFLSAYVKQEREKAGISLSLIHIFFFFVSRRFHGFRFYEPFHFVIEQFRADANR